MATSRAADSIASAMKAAACSCGPLQQAFAGVDVEDMSDSDAGGERDHTSAYGDRCHGRGYRRTVVLCLGCAVIAWLVVGRPLSGSLREVCLHLGIGAVVVVLGYVWLARWPGVQWNGRGVLLVYAFRWHRVAWCDVDRLEWKRPGSMAQCLVLHTRRGKALRVPTILLVDGSDWYSRFWESNLLRHSTNSDHPPDAMAVLTGALERRRRSEPANWMSDD